MSYSVRKHLRVEVDQYDAQIRRFIPAYETMVAVATDAVAAVEPDLVVDLGAGTGGLAEPLLDCRGVVTVELFDIDPEMLDKARRRLERFGARARFTLRSYDGPLPPCAAIAPSLSLHHIPTIEAKAELYARAFSALRPGGVLVNADTNMPADRAERDRLFRYWADHMVAKASPRTVSGGTSTSGPKRIHICRWRSSWPS